MGYDLNTTCRLCLSNSAVRSVFSSSSKLPSKSIPLHQMMKAAFCLNVNPGDGLPLKVCAKCITKLKSAFKFKSLIESSHSTLVGYFAKTLNKELPLEQAELEIHVKTERDEYDDNLAIHDQILPSDAVQKFPVFDGDSDILPYKENIKVESFDILTESYKPGLIVKDNAGILPKQDEQYNNIVENEDNQSDDGSAPSPLYLQDKDELENDENESLTRIDNPRRSMRQTKAASTFSFPVKSEIKCEKISLEDNRLAEQYACPECPMILASASGRYKHLRRMHKRKKILKERQKKGKTMCEVCGLWVAQMGYHLKTHQELKKYQCPRCPKVFKTSHSLRRHNKVIHAGVKYFCPICKTYVRCKSVHNRDVHSDKPKKFECAICGKKYFIQSQLTDHITTHTKVKNYACEVCGKLFRTRQYSNNHRKSVHEKLKPLLCTHCPKRFFNVNTFKDHVRKHTNSRIFKCDECDKSFYSSSIFAAHKKRHAGTSKVSCDICKKIHQLQKQYESTHAVPYQGEDSPLQVLRGEVQQDAP